MSSYGLEFRLIIDDALDSDDELPVYLGREMEADWLTKEDAIKLVDHLNKVFELETNRD